MGINGLLKALFGGQPPVGVQVVDVQARDYIQYQKQSAKRKLAVSNKQVSVLTMSYELRLYLSARLKPVIQRAGYTYEDQPSVDMATGSQIVIVDATPKAHAALHDKYDKILRIKKSMGKVRDLYCAVALRQDYKKYPRGTYPNMLYFCVKDGDLDHRDPDLPTEGVETIEGPCLYNLADIGTVLGRKLTESVKRQFGLRTVDWDNLPAAGGQA